MDEGFHVDFPVFAVADLKSFRIDKATGVATPGPQPKFQTVPTGNGFALAILTDKPQAEDFIISQKIPDAFCCALSAWDLAALCPMLQSAGVHHVAFDPYRGKTRTLPIDVVLRDLAPKPPPDTSRSNPPPPAA